MRQGLGRREHGHGLVRGADPRGERGGQVVRRHRVPGEVSRAGAVAGGQQPGVGGMQPHALTGQEVAIDGLLQQRVAEGVAVGTVRHEDVVGDGLAQGFVELGGREPGRGAQEWIGHPPASDGRHPRDLLDGGRQPFQPCEQDVGELLGQRDPAGTSLLGHGVGSGQQLLGVVGVALGSAADVLDDGVRDLPAVQQPQVLGELGAVERGDVETFHPREPDELGEQGTQGMTPVQVVGAVGADDEKPLVGQPRQHEAQQVAGRGVGPVQVLEHEQHRGDVVRHRVQCRQDGLVERHPLLGVVAGQLLHAAGEPLQHGPPGARLANGRCRGALDVRGALGHTGAGDVDERLGERQVGQTAGAQVDAVPDDGDEPTLARVSDQLSGEPGLADAGVAGHEHAGGRARERLLEQLLEPGELTGPADERRAGADRRHTGDRATQGAATLTSPSPRQAWRPIRTGRCRAKCSRCVWPVRRGCCCQSWVRRARRASTSALTISGLMNRLVVIAASLVM